MKTKEKSMLANITDLLKEATKILEGINKSEIPRTEREFKNEDFHIKVWETEEEIGAETIFVREDFCYTSNKTFNGMSMNIHSQLGTQIYSSNLPTFGIQNTSDTIKKSKIEGYTFQDIIEDLETANNKSLEAHSKGVTIKDVIKELEDVDTVEERFEILGKYEVKLERLDHWSILSEVIGYLDSSNAFKLGLCELRKKEIE